MARRSIIVLVLLLTSHTLAQRAAEPVLRAAHSALLQVAQRAAANANWADAKQSTTTNEVVQQATKDIVQEIEEKQEPSRPLVDLQLLPPFVARRADLEQLIDAVAHDAELPAWYTSWLQATGQPASAYSVDAHCAPQDIAVAMRDLRERATDLQTAKTMLASTRSEQIRVPQFLYERRQLGKCQTKIDKDREKLLSQLVRELETACDGCSDDDRVQFCQGQKKRCLEPCREVFTVLELQQQLDQCNDACRGLTITQPEISRRRRSGKSIVGAQMNVKPGPVVRCRRGAAVSARACIASSNMESACAANRCYFFESV